jgi:hypothetical protein
LEYFSHTVCRVFSLVRGGKGKNDFLKAFLSACLNDPYKIRLAYGAFSGEGDYATEYEVATAVCICALKSSEVLILLDNEE